MKGFSFAVICSIVKANSTPIFGTYPGWVEGRNHANIQVELFMDYLCSDCADFNTVWEEVLTTKWLDGNVYD